MFTLKPWRLSRPEVEATREKARPPLTWPRRLRKELHRTYVRVAWEWRIIRDWASKLLPRHPTATPMS